LARALCSHCLIVLILVAFLSRSCHVFVAFSSRSRRVVVTRCCHALLCADGGLPLDWLVNEATIVDGTTALRELAGTMLVLVDAAVPALPTEPPRRIRVPEYRVPIDVRVRRDAAKRSLQRCTVFGSAWRPHGAVASGRLRALAPSVLRAFSREMTSQLRRDGVVSPSAGGVSGAAAGAGAASEVVGRPVRTLQPALLLIPTLDAVVMALPAEASLAGHSMYSNVHRHHAFHAGCLRYDDSVAEELS
jgi:hypothetical protein